MKQRHEQTDSQSTRENLEHAITYGNIETNKSEPGGGCNVGFPDDGFSEGARPVIQTGPMQTGHIVLDGDGTYPLYSRLTALVDKLVNAMKSEPGMHKPNAIEELSFQWHRGRLRAEREHGTPE